MPPITLKEIANHIRKTCQIYRRLPTDKPSGYKSTLDKLTPSQKKQKTFFVTPEEIDMADEVEFNWLSCLLPDERRIVWKRFDGTQWKILAYQENLSIRQVRYIVHRSLKKILKHIKKKNHIIN